MSKPLHYSPKRTRNILEGSNMNAANADTKHRCILDNYVMYSQDFLNGFLCAFVLLDYMFCWTGAYGFRASRFMFGCLGRLLIIPAQPLSLPTPCTPARRLVLICKIAQSYPSPLD